MTRFIRNTLLLSIILLSSVFFLLISSITVIAQQLPTTSGWQQLSNTSIQAACPPDNPNGKYTDSSMTTTTWYYFYQNCKYWFDSWGGAAVDDVHKQLILFGGGHSDSENNMVLTLSLQGTPKWNLFRSPTVPVPYSGSEDWEGLAPYFLRAKDGGKYLPGAQPSSRHPYGSLQYVPSQNEMLSFGGSVSNGGFGSAELWALDMGTATWTLTAPYSKVPGNGLPPTTAYNPSNGHVVMTDNNTGLYDYDPVAGTYSQLNSNINLGNTYKSSAAIDPVHNFFVVVSTSGGSDPAYDYFPGVATTQVVRAFDLSGADKYVTHIWDDSSCNIINAYSGLQWDSALGLLVGYPGGGNKIFFLNAGPSPVSTAYGNVASHKCLTVAVGSQKGVDYPQDPEMSNGAYSTGINQRFAYFPSLDIFVLANRVSNAANAWTLRLNNGNVANFTVSASPASLTVATGKQATSTITTAVFGGFNNTISLSTAGAPSGVTLSLNPTTIPAPGAGTSVMTVSVGANTAPGTYPITVTAAGGGIQSTTTVSLTVTGSNQSLTVSANPSSLSLGQGMQGTSTATTGVGGGFNSVVGLTASGVPSGTTVTFNPVTIPAPGAGASVMTVNVGANTAPGTYSITVTATGGGLTATTTVSLTVTSVTGFRQGFNFRATAGYVSDPSYTTHVLASTRYPTKVGSVTFGWLVPGVVQSRDRSVSVDPRLAGINYVQNGTPGKFQVDLPAPGAYTVSLAMGDDGYGQCWAKCQVQFFDGTTNLETVSGGSLVAGYFYDDMDNMWSAAIWPGKNVTRQITMSGTHLTVVVGTNSATGDVTPVAFLGVSQGVGNNSDFTVSASPSALSLKQGTQGASTITTALIGSFNIAISLTASGAPAGTTVSFNPVTIPAPGSGTSAMTVSVGANTAPGTYPIAVTAAGGGIQHTATVSLTVTAAQSSLTVSANPSSLSLQQGTQGSSMVTTVIQGSFNSQVTLAATGMPPNTTVSFNPPTIPAPGAGTSTMAIAVAANTATGTYPLTVAATGGGVTATTTVTLTVTPSGSGGGNGITVSDLSGHGQSNRPISIGRFFRQGDISQFAQAVVGSTPLLTQCDVKNRWPDGSLKFAIVSFVLPSVSTGGTAVTFQNQSSGNNTGFLQMDDMLDSSYDFDAVMHLSGTVSPSISARSMLQGGSFRYWLQGPIVTAVIVEDRDGRSSDVNTDGLPGNPLHPIFEAWFYPQGKKVEVGFTLENAWSSSTASNSARNQSFALSLTTGSASPTVRLNQPTFTEWAFSRWRRAFWIGSDPLAVQFNWNPQYLVTTGAYPAYDVNYLPNASVVNAEYATYSNIATNFPARLTIPGFDDGNNGGIVNYDQAIDATGDPAQGSWIGLFPTWDIDYLLTGDPRLQKQMTDNADLAGRFPMWFREADHNAGSGAYFDYPHTGTIDPYGHVVSINARQQVTLMLNDWHPGCTGEGTDNINAGSGLSYGGWPALDTSHLPDFGFVPYTLTGKYYYLEQEEMEAGYVAGFRTGCYGLSNNYWRQGYLGMLELLLRDQAWAMRSLAYGAFLGPDGDPEGPYFRDKVLNNVARMEGEHGLPLDITDTSDRNTAYQWGYNTAIFSQAKNPSPLGAWDVDSAAYDYAQNGSVNNVNPNTLKAAGSMFQEAFMNVSLGLTRQFGIANTKALLTFAAKRPFHVLLDQGVNHYLIGQYCYPSQYTNGSWVADWPNFQANYLVLPTKWGSAGTTDDARGFQQMSGVSFMTDITVDGISGQAVWNWFKANKPNQSEFQTLDPRWSMVPLQ